MAPTRPGSLSLLSLLLLLAWSQVTTASTTTQVPAVIPTTLRALSYNETCISTGDCSSQFICSQSRCICPSDSFWNSTECISNVTLSQSPPVLLVENVTSTTADLALTPGSAWQGLMRLGVVTWVVLLDSSPRHSLSSAETRYTLTGLTKGSGYSIGVRPEIRQEGRSNTVGLYTVPFTTQVIQYGGSCSALLQCHSSLVCEDARCLCPQGQFRCSSSSCCSVNSVQPSVSTSVITASSFRVDWSTTNASYVSQYQVSLRAQGQITWERTVNTSQSPLDVTGLRSATVYDVQVISFVVDLRTQMSPPGTTSKKTRSLYNESCSVFSDCLAGSYVDCPGRCVCTSGYFRHNSECIRVSPLLVPSSFSSKMLTSSSASVSWDVPEDYEYAVTSYRVYYYINNYAISSTVSVNKNTFTLEGLLPGMQHYVQVESFLNRDLRQQYSSANALNFYTKPDTPGPLNMTGSFASRDSAFFSFATVKIGGADFYYILLTGPDGEERNETRLSTQPYVAFSNLVPGQRYQIAITAQYAGLWGIPYVDSITTRADEASVPVYGAVLLFLLPTLTLIAIVIVVVVLIRRGHPLAKCIMPKSKQRDDNYASARYRAGDDTYCSLQPANGATATSSSADSSATAAAATAATATNTAPHSDYVNDEYVQRSRGAGPEERQHIYANSEVARGGGGPDKKKALKPKLQGKPANLGEIITGMAQGQGHTPQQVRRNAP